MKNATIRLVIILATLSIIGIGITQLYWLKRAFDLKKAEFDRSVNSALLQVAQQLLSFKNLPSPVNNPVMRVSTNYYVVMVNGDIDAELLEFLLRSEFEKRRIQADFEYGIYDCSSDKMVYGKYVTSSNGKQKAGLDNTLPKWTDSAYYFGVQFPKLEAQLITQMSIWWFSTFFLLIVVVFFAYTMFVILKQKRLSEMQRDFINNMTHEFKTPLSTIAISTEVLKDMEITQYPQRLQNYVAIIENESLRLMQHVERVLKLAQSEKHSMALNWEKLDVHDLISKIALSKSLGLEEKAGSISLDLRANSSTIMADRHHFENIIYNLLDNAIKYCKQAPQIRIWTQNDRKRLVIGIADNGIGISTENQVHIFQKFFRVHTGNLHDVKGFGLGLSYVKQMVGAHRGQITVNSEPGRGSTFCINLPLA